MFTLYRIVKRSVAESVPDRASVHTAFEAVSETVRIKSEHFYQSRNCNGTSFWKMIFSNQKGTLQIDRASVHTGNASEQFLHHNRTLIPVHTVPEQLLKRSKNLSGTV